ncbi:RNA polymerase sigma factor [Saltatorellus ferox]
MKTTEIRSLERDIEAALESLPRLVRACHNRMGSPLGAQDLEEAIQETGLAAWRQRGSFRGESGVETWLYGIARYTILNQLNQRRRRVRREGPMPSPSEMPEYEGRNPGSFADTGFGRAVRKNLREAGDTAELIIRSHKLDGLTFVEISENLRMNEATVKSRYYRALPGIKSRLQGLWADVRR